MTATIETPSKTIACPEPGIYPDVPASEYRAWDAANVSSLKIIAQKTPAHMRYELDHPREATEALNVGTAAHTMIWEPEKFDAQFCEAGTCGAVVKSSGCQCTNDGKICDGGIWLCGVHARGHQHTESRIVLPPGSKANLQAMQIQVEQHKAAKAFLSLPRRNELSIVWDDLPTGVRCKARLDSYAEDREGGPAIGDLKTCENAGPDEFQKQCGDFGYDMQVAFYCDGMIAVSGGVLHQDFLFLAVEKSAPFCVGVYRAHAEMLAFGQYRYRQALEIYKWCKENNRWFGWSPNVEPLTVPRYMIEKEKRK